MSDLASMSEQLSLNPAVNGGVLLSGFESARREIEAERKYRYILGQLNINESFKNPDSIRKLSNANNWVNGFLAKHPEDYLINSGLCCTRLIASDYQAYLDSKKTTGIDSGDIENYIAWKLWEEKLEASQIIEESARRSAISWKIARTIRSRCMESIGRHAKTTITAELTEIIASFPPSEVVDQISDRSEKIAAKIATCLAEDFSVSEVLSPLFASLGLLEIDIRPALKGGVQ